MKKLLQYYYENNSTNDTAKLLRDVVHFMNCRNEHLNDNKSIDQIIKEYLIFYKNNN